MVKVAVFYVHLDEVNLPTSMRLQNLVEVRPGVFHAANTAFVGVLANETAC
jgi:hypothetical protein